MSLGHAEVVRKNFEAFNGRDIDAWLTHYRATWGALTLTAEGITEVGARVLVLGRVRARGKGSGVEIERPWAWIFEFRGDKIVRLRACLDQAEALEAGGLPE